jgi:hypothetical protein
VILSGPQCVRSLRGVDSDCLHRRLSAKGSSVRAIPKHTLFGLVGIESTVNERGRAMLPSNVRLFDHVLHKDLQSFELGASLTLLEQKLVMTPRCILHERIIFTTTKFRN